MRWGVAAAGALLVAGCARESSPPPPAAGSATAIGSTTTSVPAASPCVLSDRWESCFVEKRLENSGLVPHLLDSAVALPMFGRPARHYRLGRGELYVVLYPDSAARAADLVALDRATVSRRGRPAYAWPMPPYLVESRNAAAVLLTGSEHLTARIDDIFTAGLPTLRRR